MGLVCLQRPRRPVAAVLDSPFIGWVELIDRHTRRQCTIDMSLVTGQVCVAGSLSPISTVYHESVFGHPKAPRTSGVAKIATE
jgi:hypothetical protein